jgi:hypothetical protein
MTIYRVTWQNTETNEAHGVNVRTLVTAKNMADSLVRAKDTADIVVSIYHPHTFNEFYINFRKA